MLPLSNKFIPNIKFLNPQRPSNVHSLVKRVTSVTKMVPTVVMMGDLDALRNECRRLVLHKGHPLDLPDSSELSVEQFWSDVSDIKEGEKNFPFFLDGPKHV